MGDERDIVEIIRPHRLTPDHACVGITAVHLRTAANTIESLRAENERLRSALNDIDATAEFFVQDGVSADAMRGGHYTIRSKAQTALCHQVND